MVALIAAVLLLVALLALVVPVAKRRPVGTPLTWGEAMVAAVYAYFLMFWAYAMIPHLFLTWTSNELRLAPRQAALRARRDLQAPGPRRLVPLDHSTTRPLRDILVVVHLRGVPRPPRSACGPGGRTGASAPRRPRAVVESEYGRPLVRKG